MLAAVEFDNEVLFKASEINDIRAYGLLAAKFMARNLTPP